MNLNCSFYIQPYLSVEVAVTMGCTAASVGNPAVGFTVTV